MRFSRPMVGVNRPGANQIKALTRAAMAPCPRRQCGSTVAHMPAAAGGGRMPDVGLYRLRPPLKPVALGELAALDLLASLS